MTLLQRLAALAPHAPDPPEGLPAALALLDRPESAHEVARAADLAALAGLLPLALAPLFGLAVLPLAVGLALGIRELLRQGPLLLADAKRTRALGETPALVARLVLRARLTPAPEAAAAFAARGRGPLAGSLAGHVRRARGTGRSGLRAFGETWGDRFPALRRAVRLVETGAAAPEAERSDRFDRALDVVMEGTRHRAAEAANALRGPATALYAFGVLLPLALVAVLPAARVAGVPVSIPLVVALYDVLLPACLLVAAAWLLARRPVAFPPTPVPRTNPAVPRWPWRALLAGTVVGVGGWLLAGFLLPGWTRPLAAVGGGVGTALVVAAAPVVAVREEVRAVEAGLPDAVAHVGHRVREGVAVETALAEVGEELGGATGDRFAAAARQNRQLRVGVERAFCGEFGALASLPSRRGEHAAHLLAVAADAGRPAGQALVETGAHLTALQRVEREARRDLARVTDTLGNTAAVFGPLVGGATVALAARTGGSQLGTAVPTPALGLAVGVYVLLLAALLAALATGLSRGLDRALVAHRAGVALLAATATYLAAFVATGLVA
ncbi:hypothetical protein [Natronomonas sp. EA1]|uniref:hypothetical protein n=1 Tax=Natronomonas sp. EA1 TaxID=3421655 RepID=UPI003EBBC24A